MATIKVKLTPTTHEGGKGVIVYQITHNHKKMQIRTKFRISKNEWNIVKEILSDNTSEDSKIHQCIRKDTAFLQQIINKLEKSKIEYCVSDIIRLYNIQGYRISLFDYAETIILQLKAANRLGTARNYEKALNSLKKFLVNEHLSLAALDEDLINDYNAYLIGHGLRRNSISFYMRTLRAIYNKAVRQKLIEQSNPFSEVYTGIDNTRKRAISESIILKLYKLELPEYSPIAFTRDLFLFSYCTRGMAFVDMAYLKKSNIQDGTLSYIRHKTGQHLMVRIEPSIQRIIDRYNTSDTEYIFPIIRATDSSEAYHQYVIALNTYNRMLHKLSEISCCGCKLTSYTARHSWATAAHKHNIPISIISAGMGHTSEQTTRIYLSSLENSIIDEANLELINMLIDSSIKEPL